MSPLNPIDPLKLPGGALPAPLPANEPLIDEFERWIDRTVKEKLSQPVLSPAAIQAQQSLEEFRHKLAVLSGMLDQAEAAMRSERKPEGGPSSPNEQKYFLLKSKISQVGLPDGASNLI